MHQRASVIAIAIIFVMAMATGGRADAEEISIAEVHAAYASGTLTVRKLVEDHLTRIHQLDRNGPKLNAVPVLNLDALAEAEALDREVGKGGPLRPLAGIPIVVKDMIHVRGLPTSVGLVGLSDARAAADAPVIARLRNAGAIILGKTNLTGYGTYSAESAAFGLTLNPYDPERSAMGSSGGSAVAVASGLAVAALGEETTDPLRARAAATGLVAIQPRRGRVDPGGVFPFSAGFDEIGPMARTVDDAARVLDVISSPGLPSVRSGLSVNALKGKRLGVPAVAIGKSSSSGPRYPLDPKVAELFDAVRRELRAAGAEVVDVALDLHTHLDLDAIDPSCVYYTPPAFRDAEVGFRAAALDRFARTVEVDGVRDFAGLVDYLARRRIPSDEAFVKNFAPEAALSAAHKVPDGKRVAELFAMLDAERVRRLSIPMRKKRLDALVFPTMYRQPLLLTEEASAAYFGTGVTIYAPNAFGTPAITVPMGEADGLPASVTFMGDLGDDTKIVGIAYAYEQRTKHRRPPALT